MPKLKGLARILAAAAKDAAATGDWDKAIEILREIQTGVRGHDRNAIDKVLAYNVAMRDGSGRGR